MLTVCDELTWSAPHSNRVHSCLDLDCLLLGSKCTCLTSACITLHECICMNIAIVIIKFSSQDLKALCKDSFEVPVPPTNHTIIEPGGNVTFRCPYSVGSLVQQVMWERIKVDRMDTIVLCNLSEGKTYGSDYQERAMIDCATQESDILVIQNVTSSDSGIYRCRYGGNKTHVMSLTVTSATLDHHWHILLIAGGAAASLLLLVTILIISITAVYRKKKKRRRIMKALSKALYSTQTRPSNSYGRSNFCGAPNNRRGVASVSGAMDEIYINYRDFSRKPKTRT
nr:CD226 antigen isoform X2 [Chrysemys picta bellii]